MLCMKLYIIYVDIEVMMYMFVVKFKFYVM